jgi:hypothetical protein
MKKIFTIVLLICSIQSLQAQSWNITGNSGLTASNFLGSTDNHTIIFKVNNTEFGRIAAQGYWRFGHALNYARIDTSGKLTFGGNGAYQVAGNKYVFQYTGNLNQGLFFNLDSVQYEFRNGSSVPVFAVNANTGNSVFKGTLKIGAYTLPSTDGTGGQVLTTNGSGAVSWSKVSGNSGANTSLSNLAATTAINADLLPGTNNSISLGSSGKEWANIFIGGALYIGGTKFLTAASSDNTGVGLNALHANTIGSWNTANGYEALFSNTTGNENTANGMYALFSNTTGNSNTVNGAYALAHNIIGSYNTANGEYALLLNTSGDDNTANGYAALSSNTTGDANTANGYQALYNNTTGGDNTANGYDALYSNTTGGDNTANGYNALFSNTTGSRNTANGDSALFSNTTGIDNSANGYAALYNNTTGGDNTANGYDALYSNTTGGDNTANGVQALYSNTTGNENTANGLFALYHNTTGSYNTANGEEALYINTTGYDNTANGNYALFNNTTGYDNTANGYSALASNTTGYDNVANGASALSNNTTGYSNIAMGEYSQPVTGTGWQNTSIGTNSLTNNTSGSYNTAVGYNTDNSESTNVNTTCLGIDATATGDNMVRIGNVYVTSIGGQVGWSTLSDGRFKENIKENVPGLNFINLLRPVTYNINRQKVDDYTGITKSEQQLAKNNPQQKFLSGPAYSAVTTGFIAQEVEQASKKINYDFSGVDAPKNDKDMYGLRYADFVVPLVKGEQELSKQNDSLTATVNSLQKQIDELKALVLSGSYSSSAGSSPANKQTIELGGTAALSQNIPNPFSNSTDIGYYLPVNNGNASINFYDVNGTPLKTVLLSGSGKGIITLKAAELPSGVYRYTLVADGKLIGSRQMEKLK